MTERKIPLAGVLGSPISHSKSPQLHRHWLETNEIEGHYIPMDVAPEDFETVLRALPKAGFVGANVTIPHKEAALTLADVISDRAKRIGAANTLVFHADGKIEADNTDGYGFLQNLLGGVTDWNAAQGPAMVIGAGGAARAVLFALLEAGVPEILLTNRTRARAETLAAVFGGRISVIDWSEAETALAQVALLVNTSSLGMVGQPELTLGLDKLAATTVVTDLVYNPLKTALLQTAKARGRPTVDGLGMLLHQGVPGFERWFGVRPEVTAATRAAVLA